MSILNQVREELKGMSTYVPGTRVSYVKEKYNLEKVVKLASNENPLGVSPKAVQAIKDAANGVNIYPDSECNRLRGVIADKLSVKSEQVIVGNGGEEIIRFICEALLDKDDEVVISELGFGLHIKSSQLMGAKVNIVPLLPNYDYDFDGFLGAISDKTKIVFITNPANPTGKVTERSVLEAFLAKVPSNVLVLIDEAYYEFATFNKDYPNGIDYLDTYKNVMVLRTFSKVAGLAGLRVGFGIASVEFIGELNKIKGVFNVSVVAIEAACAAMQDDEHIEKSVELNRESLKRMMEYFNKKNIEYLEPHGNFIFVDFKTDGKELYNSLLEKGVILRGGFLWGKDTWMRISSGTMEETKILIDALDAVL